MSEGNPCNGTDANAEGFATTLWNVVLLGDRSSPESIFERRWAATLLEQALGRLRDEFTTAGKARQFDLLKLFLTSDADPGGYDEIAAQLETSPQTVAVSVLRLRQRYRATVRAEISHTVNSPNQIEGELRGLFA